MGCFLACFGSSRDRKRRKQRNQVLPREQKHGSYKPVRATVPLKPDNTEQSTEPVSDLRDKPEEQLSFSARKRVTFDSNVKTYEHISDNEIDDNSLGGATEKAGDKEKEESLAKSSQSHITSKDGSDISSSGSYPPNHRYHNCRDSDDEGEVLQFEESDLYDDDDDDDDGDEEEYSDYEEDESLMESRTGLLASQVITEEVNSPISICGSPDRELKTVGSNRNVRDRSAYVHSVLNPVENLAQWKAVKTRGTSPLKQQRENFSLDQEPRISFSLEPPFKDSSFSFKSKSDQPQCAKEEIAVNASLSNWLVSPETTPISKTSSIASEMITSEKSTSLGSNSLISFEDRPILGALTVEELQQFSASCSPRRSPSRSPDEMAIIGTVGTYWGHTDTAKDSGSASSYKGIPNTTSKYREDKRVNWHSTPFETRLERALNSGAADAKSTYHRVVC